MKDKRGILGDLLYQQRLIRSEINKEGHPFPALEVKFFRQIPEFKENQVMDLIQYDFNDQPVGVTIKGCEFRVSCEVLEKLRSEPCDQVSPCFAVVVLFHGIAAAILHQEDLNHESFYLLVECLARVASQSKNPRWAQMSDYVFGLLLRLTMQREESFIDVKCYMAAIDYISKNQSIDSSLYSCFVQFVSMAIDSKEPFQRVCSLLCQLFNNGSPLVCVDDHTELVETLERCVSTFDCGVLRAMAAISKRWCRDKLKDVFSLLGFTFLNFIQSKRVVLPVVQSECEVLEYQSKQIELQVKTLSDFHDGLLPLPSDVTGEFDQVILPSDDVQQVVNNLHCTVTECNRVCAMSFFTAYVDGLESLDDEGTFYTAVLAFLILFKEQYEIEYLEQFVQKLCHSRLMSPKHCLFAKGTLSPVVSAIRNEFLELVLSIDRKVLPTLINYTFNYPMLSVEILARICAKEGIDMSLFADSQTLKNIALLALFFQGRPDSEVIRSVVFAMIFKLCQTRETALICFSLPDFIEIYFSFLFETNISQMILSVFQQSCYCLCQGGGCVIEPTISYLVRRCQDWITCGHVNILTCLCNAISEMSRSRPRLTSWFCPLLMPLVSNIGMTRDKLFIATVLELLACFSGVNSGLELDMHIFDVILSAVRNSGMSKEVFMNMLRCLAGVRVLSVTERFLIRHPLFLPLILATATDVFQIIMLLTDLAKFSNWNAGAMHDGDVDVILLDYLSSEQDCATVHYAGTEITMSFTKLQRETIVCPLLLKICSAKSSYAVALKFLDLAGSSHFLSHLLLEFMGHMVSQPRRLFAIGTYDHVCKITGLRPSDLSSKCTISMWIKIDVALLRDTNKKIVILAIDDSEKMGHLEVFMTGSEVYSGFQYGSRLTSVKLLKYVPSNQWFLLSLVIENYQDGALLRSYVNYHKHMDSELCKIMLHQGPMTITIGGQTGAPDGGLLDVAELSDLCIHRGELRDSQIEARWAGLTCQPDSLILSTRELTQDKHVQQFGKLTFTVEAREMSAKPLLYHFDNGILLNRLTSLLGHGHIDDLFGTLQLIFSASKDAQRNYATTALVSSLIQTKELNLKMYHLVYCLYRTITDDGLRIEWLRSVLLKMALWIKADPDSLFHILCFWKTSLLPASSSLFLQQSFFTDLLCCLSTMIIDTDEFSTQMGTKALDIKSLFVDCLVILGKTKLNQSDLDSLVSYCAVSGFKEVYLRIMRLLAVAMRSLDTADCLNFLRQIISMEEGTVWIEAILTLHDLMLSDVQQEVLFIVYLSEERLRFLFNEIQAQIVSFPYLCDLLFILSLRLEPNDRELVSEFLDQNPVIQCKGLWYFFPCLYVFYASRNSQAIALQFIGNHASVEEITKVFALLTLFQSTLDCGATDIPLMFMKILFGERQSPEISESLSDENQLENERKDQVIFTCLMIVLFVRFNANKMRIRTINEINSFVVSYSDLHPQYESPFDAHSESIDDELEKNQIVLMLREIQEPTNTDSIKLLAEGQDWSTLEKPVEKMLSDMREIMQLAKSQFAYAHEELNTRVDIHPVIERDRCLKTDVVQTNHDDPLPVRDWTLCLGLVPMKLKVKHTKINQSKESTYTERPVRCFVNSFIKQQERWFSVSKSTIILQDISGCRSKVIPLADVNCIWQRTKRGAKTQLEILTSNDRLILIDFADSSDIVVNGNRSLSKLLQKKTWNVKTEDWQSGRISNFEYLLRLNLASGRSFNDCRMYPIFPALISNIEDDVGSLQLSGIERLWAFSGPPLSLDDKRIKVLAPEYFCVPEVVREGDTLPNWAQNGFDIVYGLRKRLESPDITSKLPSWIDRVWGMKCPKNIMHTQLFLDQHPHRRDVKPEKPRPLSRRIPIQSKLVFACCDGVRLSACSEDGKAHFAEIKIDPTTQEIHVKLLRSEQFVVGSYFSNDPSSITCCSPSCLSMIDSDGRIHSLSCPSHYEHLAFARSFMVYCQSGSTLRIRRGDTDSCFCYANARVSCLAVSEDFHVLAYGTMLAQIHLVSTTNAREVRSVSLDDEIPTSILLTQSWGFVVVRAQRHIFVFNVNGMLIRKFAMPNHIIRWTTFSTRSGFDYIAYQDTNAQIYVSEAPSAPPSTPVLTCRNLVSMSFDETHCSLIIVTATKKVKCVPLADIV